MNNSGQAIPKVGLREAGEVQPKLIEISRLLSSPDIQIITGMVFATKRNRSRPLALYGRAVAKLRKGDAESSKVDVDAAKSDLAWRG
jgi:hypothetical protein